MNGAYSIYSKRKGRPGEIERAVGKAVYELYRKHGASYIPKDQLSGIILCAVQDAVAECRSMHELFSKELNS